MLRLSLVPILLMVVGCGTRAGGTVSNAETVCADGGFDTDQINESFENVRQGKTDGFTRTEMLAVSAPACADSCGADDTCGAACVDCTFAIVAEVY